MKLKQPPSLLRPIGAEALLAERVSILCRHLDSPLSGIAIAASPAIQQDFLASGDLFLNETLVLCENKIEQISKIWTEQIRTTQNAKWVVSEYGDAMTEIVSNFTTISLSSPIALLEIVLICVGSPTIVATLPHIISWFIRHADQALITKPEVLTKLGHTYYRDYVARLEACDLNKYLCSPETAERVIAVNKVKLEMDNESST